ncbi:L-lysine 2,3-aminomutase [Colletotrichum tamarilloi]|uniref:L-lysine 2,3-aminomutase n=1 Tax=Colletotrichum tamarilloi TaxID=1209934 RepID=A0ABQ9RVM7_9PEZI|nr:L-lysine 2,3-aminomutase [Colletotrichum tamarilloi]KAK1513180.1 L-lysine 2,3-aminomutase [Colletotrichum tamarilloi]
MLSLCIPVRAAARFIQATQRGQGARWIATPSRLQAAQAAASETVIEEPMYHDHVEDVSTSDRGRRDEFWRRIPWWQDISTEDFLSYRWSSRNMVERLPKLRGFLDATLPDYIPVRGSSSEMEPRNELVNDVLAGIKKATMSVRLTPYVLSRIDWTDPRNDPIFRQFIPTQSSMVPDHPRLTLDSLHEEADSPVPGLVHRYPDKALFLPVSVCPTYCMFCTRSYAVGANTETVDKHSFKPILARWEKVFQYIENTPDLQDIVVSGGDSYYLAPHQIELIGDRLISMPNIRRFRFASKGLAVCPTRILDPNDTWVDALVSVSNKARRAGKAVALHTHFNHPNEISWVSEEASQKLFEAGVVVRNQTVLLRGVNDDAGTMSMLIRKLANNNILPYYVYQCDMVKMVEHLRTPLQTILDLESKIRGSIAGFVMPQFVVDLPGGGGKRLASTHRSYDRKTGISTYVAPAVTGRDKENKVYEYYDPVDSLPETQPTDFLDGASRHIG